VSVKHRLNHWEAACGNEREMEEFVVRLSLKDAARIRALSDVFPGQAEGQIIADLLDAALKELLGEIPYVKGDKVIAEDELGDPIYEDVGLTPRLHAATEKHLHALRDQRNH
jgi:hypothetical protein